MLKFKGSGQGQLKTDRILHAWSQTSPSLTFFSHSPSRHSPGPTRATPCFLAIIKGNFTVFCTETALLAVRRLPAVPRCMLAASPTRATRATRLASFPPLVVITPVVPARRFTSDPVSKMFQRAVNKHTVAAPRPTSTTGDRSLKQQLFPSSSPAAQSGETKSGQPLRPAALGHLNRPSAFKPPYKRTSDGLAKALGDNGHSAFDDPTKPRSPERQVSTPNGHVFFNENDFDSDPDLEVEEPAWKNPVSYPKLPVSRAPVTYPSLNQKAAYHAQASDSGYASRAQTAEHLPPSSEPFPWSSSPDSHFARPPPAQANRFAAYKLPGSTIKADTAAHASVGDQSDNPRPVKRRTLPWLEDQPRETSPTAPTKSVSTPKAVSTPLPKEAASGKFPWNTTASAVKEQQKLFRKAYKKPVSVRENDATDEARRAAIEVKKSKNVARPYLSQEQRQVLDLVVESGKSVFFTGSAGTGKSVLLREIITVLRKKYARESDRVAITASTGLAACNIGGVTLHSFAGIGLGKEEVSELVKKIKRNQKAKHRWLRTKVLIMDEISMVDGDLFDKLEAVARQIRNNGRPFGGVQLVITGDFFQLPPVPDGHGASSTFAFDAKSWSAAIQHTIGLHHVFRQKDPVFAGMLNEMREGRLTKASIDTFRSLSRTPESNDHLSLTLTELFPTRSEVERANLTRMNQLKGNEVRYIAKDGGTLSDEKQRSRILENYLAPKELVLKKGSQVMLIKNMDETLVNGSLGKVTGFMNELQFGSYMSDPDARDEPVYQHEPVNAEQARMRATYELLMGSTSEIWPVVRFAIADGTTRDLLCTREVWKTELPNGEIQASRAQVPLILAWALSIHKAQGQTLDRVKVDLGKVFEKGQAYVALSRATSIQGLQVLRFDPSKVQAHPKVRTFYSNLTRIENAGKQAQGS